MHITCTPPCKFDFCWLCLGAWSEHGERTGGFYACNHYETAKQEGVYDEAEKRREMAKNSLERYTHYYERWATNQSQLHVTKSNDEQQCKAQFVKSQLCNFHKLWSTVLEDSSHCHSQEQPPLQAH